MQDFYEPQIKTQLANRSYKINQKILINIYLQINCFQKVFNFLFSKLILWFDYIYSYSIIYRNISINQSINNL